MDVASGAGARVFGEDVEVHYHAEAQRRKDAALFREAVSLPDLAFAATPKIEGGCATNTPRLCVSA